MSLAEPLDEGKKTGGETLDGGSVLNNRRHWIMIWVRLSGPYPDNGTRLAPLPKYLPYTAVLDTARRIFVILSSCVGINIVAILRTAALRII